MRAPNQACAKPNCWTRNRNQWGPIGTFRTTKSKPTRLNGKIRNQNRNKYINCENFEIKIKTKMSIDALFKTETKTNRRSYLVTMTS